MSDRPRDDKGRFISLAEADMGNPQSGEIATISSSISGFNFENYNPDDLARSKGGLKIYRQMVADPHVKAALQQKKTALLAVPWDIAPGGADESDLQVADFVRWNLMEYLEDSFSTDLMEFLFALDDGFSIAEKIWAMVPDGPWAGKWAYKKFKPKDPSNYRFALDAFGNILPNGLINDAGSSKSNKSLPVDKFFIYSYNRRYGNPYGQSDLRAAYRAFWIKDVAWKLRSIYMERYSGNFLKGTYKAGDKKGQAKLIEIFQSWSQETGIALPSGIDVEVLQLATSGESEYKRAIADASKEIIIGILGATLTVDEGQKTGARALGDVHKQVADLFVLSMDIALSSEINKQIIRPLVDFNFSGIANYPKFTFEARTKITTQDIKVLKDAGIAVPDDWVYRKFRIPKPTQQKTPTTPMFKYHIDAGSVSRNEIRERLGLAPLSGDYFDKPIDPASLVSSPQVSAAFSEGVLTPIQAREVAMQAAPAAPGKFQEPEENPVNPTGRILPDKTDLEPGQFWRAPNQAEKFAEIDKVDEATRSTEQSAINGSQPIYDDIQASVLKQVKKKGILEQPASMRAKAIEDAANVVVNPKALKEQLFNAVLINDQLGRVQLMTEIENQDPTFKFTEAIKLAEPELNVEVLDTATAPEEVVKLMAKRTPMTRKAFNALVDVKQSEAFYVAGLEKKNIEKDVQPLIVQAIDEGWDLREFEFRLDQVFVKYKEPVFNQVGTAGEKVLDYHVQTVFRNAMMTSYNEGRDQMRSDPDVIEAFPANFYSAIMDNRVTRDICFELDGSVFLANDTRWDKYKPQNHHMCRSILITINKFDFTPAMLSPLPSIVIPVGFGG